MAELARQSRILFPTRRLLGILALACTCALVAPAASSDEDDLESFGETLDVVVVEVEAVVTDSDGRRVAGLSREDFRLRVDGEEVPIDYFTEVREGRLVESSGTGPVSRPDDPEPGDPVPTNYLVFIDEYFSIGARRDYVVGRLAARVRDLPPQDRMAVVAFDGEEIEVLADWNTPRPELEAALTGAVGRPAYGLLRAAEWVRRGQGGPWHDALAQRQELERVLTALRSTLRMVPRPDGRKALLVLGGGWWVEEVYVWPGRNRDLQGRGDSRRFGDISDIRMMSSLVDTANLLGYTVYPIDVNGLRDPGGQRRGGETPFAQELFRQGVLRDLAQDTGGRALLFADRERPLEAVVEDTRSYYSMGFTPALSRDGSYHEVRLEVRRRGLDVRARTGFRDVSRAAELNLLAESALRFGAGSEAAGDGGSLIVDLGRPQSRSRRTMVVPIRLDVPWREVTLLPDGDGWAGRLEIRLAVRDQEGAVSDVAMTPLEVQRDARPAEEGTLRWESDITLRRERHDLVVSVYDALSGQVLTQQVPVEP